MLTWLNEKFGSDSGSDSDSDYSDNDNGREMKGLLTKRKNAVERYLRLCQFCLWWNFSMFI